MRDPINLLLLAKEAVTTVIALGTAIAVRYRLRGARHWPMTHGKVEFWEAMNEKGTTWTIHVYYSYVVSGEYFSGQHLLRARNERLADEIGRNLKGQTATVRYSSGNPANCVLLPSDQMSFLEGAFQTN